MIRKLQRKFVATNMLLVSLVLVVLFAAQLFGTYQRSMDRVSRAAEDALSWADTGAPPFEFTYGKYPPDHGQKNGVPMIPAFSVEYDESNTVTAIHPGPGVTVSEELAQTLVDEALAQDSGHGTLPGRALTYLHGFNLEKQYFAFVDESFVGETVRTQALSSGLICLGALAVFFLISLFLSKLALRPVETAWEQQRQFVADASHELKTPITVILANSGIILAHPDDPVSKQAKWITYIQDEAARMKSLVDDLLFLAKSDAAKQPLHPAPVRLSELVTGSLLPFESVAFESGVALEEDVTPGLTLQGDEAQLRRLVVILLDNAVKYAGAGGRVTVRLEKVQEKAVLSVHNTGAAIAPQHLPHLFERFYRADEARDRAQGGYGLGLSIAKSVAEAHSGKISVTSTPEAGTTFTVVLPRK